MPRALSASLGWVGQVSALRAQPDRRSLYCTGSYSRGGHEKSGVPLIGPPDHNQGLAGVGDLVVESCLNLFQGRDVFSAFIDHGIGYLALFVNYESRTLRNTLKP